MGAFLSPARIRRLQMVPRMLMAQRKKRSRCVSDAGVRGSRKEDLSSATTAATVA